MTGNGNQVYLNLKTCFEKFVKSLQVKIMESRIEHCDLTGKKIIPKCDHVVKEYVPVTFKWAKAVSPLFSIQWIASVTKVQSPDRQIFLLSNFSTIPQPIIMARVTVAPLVGVKANTEKTTFAFSGACAEK